MANRGLTELRRVIEHKPALKGIPVVLVDRRHTSQPRRCRDLIDRRNRPNQVSFRCIGCGFAAPADHSAACETRQRGMRATSFVVTLEGRKPGLLR